MKAIKVLCSLIIMVAVLSASILSASAIGFEAEVAYESVFVIYSGNALGSGFAVGENCIVTNAHVIENKRNITVETYGGESYKATLLGMDEELDIAVLAVAQVTFPYLAIGDMSQMKIGDDIYAIGAPRGMTYTLTKGGISAKEREVSGQTYIQIDAAINQGNSGGPLLNDAGEVLGMNTLKMSNSEGIGLAIPISRICQYLSSLGIVLDENGNVADSVGPTEEPQPTNPTNPTEPSSNPKDPVDDEPAPETEKKDSSKFTSIIVVVAGLSVTLNIILLVVLLVRPRKAKPPAPSVPSDEDYDFEIDILE